MSKVAAIRSLNYKNTIKDLVMTDTNKITIEFLKSEITDVKYTRINDRLTHCAITVKNGFVFTGESSCVDAANYDKELGEKYAYEAAIDGMWMPYGFALRQKLYGA